MMVPGKMQSAYVISNISPAMGEISNDSDYFISENRIRAIKAIGWITNITTMEHLRP